MIKLEQWSVTTDNPYAPPEASLRSLHGLITGHLLHEDGNYVRTSNIVKVEGNIVHTQSGSVYELGTPDPTFIQWCKDNDCYVPTKEEPIRLRKI